MPKAAGASQLLYLLRKPISRTPNSVSLPVKVPFPHKIAKVITVEIKVRIIDERGQGVTKAASSLHN